MASEPQTITITATYFPDVNGFHFDQFPPFTSNQAVTQFVFDLALGLDASGQPIPGKVNFDPSQPVVWGTPPPPPTWTVALSNDNMTVTITDFNSNTSSVPNRFPFSFQVIYDGPLQTPDPTIINAQIPPGGGDGIPTKTSTASNP
jgi:hypothetical protein